MHVVTLKKIAARLNAKIIALKTAKGEYGLDDYFNQLSDLFTAISDKEWFLDLLFGEYKQGALNSTPVVLFGSGSLGEQLLLTLRKHGVYPACFCDNDSAKSGSLYCGIPVISFAELAASHHNSLIIIATLKYLEPLTTQLLENGFCTDRTLCKASDSNTELIFMYSIFCSDVLNVSAQIKRYNLIITANSRHRNAIKRIRKQSKITVAFFTHFSSVWNYDELYKKMAHDNRFEPIIIVCPHYNYGESHMLKNMKDTFNYFSNKKYNVFNTYDENSNEWLDIKDKINPDIIFLVNPYPPPDDKYHIFNFADTLLCYVPYGFMTANIQYRQYNADLHNLAWKCFYETNIHKEMAIKYAANKGSNVIVTGHPMCDLFLDKTYQYQDVWKIKDRKIKRIIWAPHHSIENEGEMAYSNFLHLCRFMLDLAKEYKGKIQFAFKPHPHLLTRLYNHEDWGEIKAHRYYEEWRNLSNGQLEEGDYTDLFLSSDAMIMDSMSFIAEYGCTGKPSLFTVRDDTIKDKFNEFGKIAYEFPYKSFKNADIIDFINDVVLDGNDYLADRRNRLIKEYLMPPNNKTATDNIFDDLALELR